jgi:hypothetical protein
MSSPVTVGKVGWFSTGRRDNWWVEPALVVFGLGMFAIYSVISAVILDSHFEYGPYLSPYYEPLIEADWWKFSPAILIMWVPLGFRATCYYYRGAYYKAFFLNPPACSVTGSQTKTFTGERKFPLILQNFHRYFLFLALIFNVLLWIGAIRAFWHEGQFGIGVGTVVLLINAFLLMMYSLSCHSIRHLVGGRLNCFSCSGSAKAQHKAWMTVSCWNEVHKRWAWSSLIFVALTDLYIRLVAWGIIPDYNTWSNI